MSDWFRSLGIFGTAFAAVVVFTLGVAGAIVPSGAVQPQSTGAPPPGGGSAPVPVTPAQPTAVGGTLEVSGDREGSFKLERETTQDRYGLVGPEGRILFDGPEALARVQYDGLEFFLEPDDCTVTPGARHDPTGVAGADIRCESIEDVRGNGIITLDGRVGVAADLFGLRGDLPETGGTTTLGDETLTFDAARFTVFSFGGFAGQLVDDSAQAVLTFAYDPQTHELSLAEVGYGGEVALIDGGCSLEERQIGLLNPHTRVVELQVSCLSVDVPTLGPVPLDGSVIVEITEPPG